MFRPMGVIFRLNLGTYFTSLFLQCSFYHFAIGIPHALQLEYENLLVLSVRNIKGTSQPWMECMWLVLPVELPPVGCGGVKQCVCSPLCCCSSVSAGLQVGFSGIFSCQSQFCKLLKFVSNVVTLTDFTHNGMTYFTQIICLYLVLSIHSLDK